MVPGVAVVPWSLGRGTWKLVEALPLSLMKRGRVVMIMMRRRMVIVSVSQFVVVVLMIRAVSPIVPLLSRIPFASSLTIILVVAVVVVVAASVLAADRVQICFFNLRGEPGLHPILLDQVPSRFILGWDTG